MMHEQSLSMFFWEEVSKTILYVRNRCSHKILKKMTLKESFMGVKLEVVDLRIFGFPGYIHVPKDKRMNLEHSRKKGIFVGYIESSNAHRICIPRSRKIEVNRDVTFEEEMSISKGRGSNMEIDDDEDVR